MQKKRTTRKKDIFQFVDKPNINKISSKFIFLLPNDLREAAKLIVAKRAGLSLGGFVREAVESHIQRYKQLMNGNGKY